MPVDMSRFTGNSTPNNDGSSDQVTDDSVAARLSNFIGNALNAQPVRDVKRGFIDAATNPAKTAANAIGTPGRMVQSGVVAAHDWTGNPILNALIGAAQGTVDTEGAYGKESRIAQIMGLGADSQGTSIADKSANFGRHMAVGTALDPLTYLPFIGEGASALRGATKGAQMAEEAARAGAESRAGQSNAGDNASASKPPVGNTPLVYETEAEKQAYRDAHGGQDPEEIGSVTSRPAKSPLQKMLDAAQSGVQNVQATIKPAIDQFRHMPGLDDAATDAGRYVFTGIGESEARKGVLQNQADAALLKPFAKQMNATGVIPPEIRQRLLRDAYLHGDTDGIMRQQTLDLGYDPVKDGLTPEQIAAPPTGHDVFNIREDYEPLMNPNGAARPAGDVGTVSTPGAMRQGYDQAQTGRNLLQAPLADRVAYRLRKGVAFRQQAATAQRRMEEMGLRLPATDGAGPLYADSADIAHANARLDKYVTDSGKLEDLINQRPANYAEFPLLSALADAGRDSIKALILPHMGNVSVAQLMSAGPGTFAKGLQYMAKGVPEDTQRLMDQYGVTSSLAYSTPNRFSPTQILSNLIPEGVRNASKNTLHNFENSMRAANVEKQGIANPAPAFDGRTFNPQSIDDEARNYGAAFQTRKNLGDYGASSAATRFMRSAGASFPQWHTKIVPEMLAGALKNRPDLLDHILRLDDRANEAYNADNPYNMETAKPDTEGARALFDPAGYFTSPSTVGPVGSFIKGVSDRLKPDSLGASGDIDNVARSYVGGYDLIKTMLGLPQFANSKIDPSVQAAAAPFGMYPKLKRSDNEQNILDMMQSTGEDRYSVGRMQRMMRKYAR